MIKTEWRLLLLTEMTGGMFGMPVQSMHWHYRRFAMQPDLRIWRTLTAETLSIFCNWPKKGGCSPPSPIPIRRIAIWREPD
ncbi:hypothetical protein GCM10023219_26430 [Stakelama sediminis]